MGADRPAYAQAKISEGEFAPTKASRYEKVASTLARSAAIVFSDSSLLTDFAVSAVDSSAL
ncbi:hypothetical protein [Mesorhizobium sp. WSM2561]|uniref:hypothetical protein n=1 Tax=Mesorhizobium sp. WSM2561 TaxID=1040985 RepID=UPI000488FAD2